MGEAHPLLGNLSYLHTSGGGGGGAVANLRTGLRCVTYLYYDPNLNCCYEKCRSINNSLRARSIRKTYQPAFFHLGECATYQPAIDQSDWPIQTVVVQG